MKLMQRMITTMVRPGKVTSHHLSRPASCPSSSSAPSAGVGGRMPKPRNESTASREIAIPTVSVAATTIGPIVFGSMWRSMIRRSPAPAARAASTYSFSRSDRKTPRTIRAMVVQISNASRTASVKGVLLLRNFAAVRRTASSGNVRKRSVTRISRLSIQPP